MVFLLASVLALAGCSGGDNTVKDPLLITIPGQSGGIIDQGEALVLSASGLEPGEYPVLVEVRNSNGEAVSELRLTADVSGNLTNVVLAYDVGLFDTSGPGYPASGTYTVALSASGGTVDTVIVIPHEPLKPVVWETDIDGEIRNAFQTGDPVYVSARGCEPGVTYRVWPVADRRSWNDGDIIKSWQSDYPAVVWPPEIEPYVDMIGDIEGEINSQQLLPYATKMIPGVTDQFDVVLDAEPYGIYNADTDAVDGKLPTGVVVQDLNPGGPVYTELASGADYTYHNTFTEGSPVYAWLNPGIIIEDPDHYILKYILEHSDVWVDGTSLEDITGMAEMDPVQIGCVNEALVLVWPVAEPGEYDIFLDINGNGIYDEETDVLDGGPDGPGFVVQ